MATLFVFLDKISAFCKRYTGSQREQNRNLCECTFKLLPHNLSYRFESFSFSHFVFSKVKRASTCFHVVHMYLKVFIHLARSHKVSFLENSIGFMFLSLIDPFFVVLDLVTLKNK